MPRLSFLALCLNLALLAVAAPVTTPGMENTGITPDATSKATTGSLQTATDLLHQMEDMYKTNSDSDSASASEHNDVGNKSPKPMIPNSEATFPGADQFGVTPSSTDDGEDEEQASKPSSVAVPSASPSPSAVPGEELKTSTGSGAQAAPSPSHVVENDPLSGLPLVGGLLSGGGIL